MFGNFLRYCIELYKKPMTRQRIFTEGLKGTAITNHTLTHRSD